MDSAFLSLCVWERERDVCRHNTKELKETPTNRLTRAPSLPHFITIEIRILDERKSGSGNSKICPFLPSKYFHLYHIIIIIVLH